MDSETINGSVDTDKTVAKILNKNQCDDTKVLI